MVRANNCPATGGIRRLGVLIDSVNFIFKVEFLSLQISDNEVIRSRTSLLYLYFLGKDVVFLTEFVKM